MGSSSSKVARKLPTKARPSWAGTTTSELSRVQQESARSALASETRTKDIEMDSGDPQFLQKLNQLGPVKVDHHMTAFRTNENMRHILHTQEASEQQATSRVPPKNRILAGELFEILERRKTAKSVEEIRQIAMQYNLDPDALSRLARVVNTPSVIPGTKRKVVGDNGEERDTMLAGWTDREPSDNLTRSP